MTKFCTACQRHKAEEGGATRVGKRFSRWMCHGCATNQTESIYKSKGTFNAKDYQRLLNKLSGGNYA